MKKFIAIDGASRRNGKPDCVSAGGLYIQEYHEDVLYAHKYSKDASKSFCYTTHRTLSGYEIGSTSQRGELLALLIALDFANFDRDQENFDLNILTDSAYIYNSITKEWPRRWINNGWITAEGKEVANRDLWEKIWEKYRAATNDITFYIIKGHLLSLGKVTAAKLLADDPTGEYIFDACTLKYCSLVDSKKEILVDTANEHSLIGNGFKLEPWLMQKFICMNLVADTVATKCVEAINALKS